jgi:hypothetical protein
MARKRASAKKKAAALSSIEVDVDLGNLTATPEQQARLRAHLNSTLLTWVKSDLKGRLTPPIVIFDHTKPPAGEESGNE